MSFLGQFETIRLVLEHCNGGVVEELRMIGQFNKELRKELFDKMKINAKLTKYFIPTITVLWLLTTGKA